MSIKHLAGIGVLLMLITTGCSDRGAETQQAPDAAAVEANNRGVGLMGRFEYADAQAVFQEIVDEWPDWHDARLNLAIATLNTQEPGSEAAALALAREVLVSEPDNLRAHYIAGLVKLFLGRPDEAAASFEAVAEGDPTDAHAAYYLAQCLAQQSDYERALPWYERAMELDPYLRSAYYGAFQTLQRLGRDSEARELAGVYQRLENNPRSHLAEFKYTRMGPRGAALTLDIEPRPAADKPAGPLFAEATSLSIGADVAWKRRAASANRTPSITVVDLQDDGVPDLFLAGVIEMTTDAGDVIAGNLLLHGEDGGGYRALTDHPLASVSNVNAALWGDYDNDGLVDVYLCRRGGNQLWRQTETDVWEDVTAATGTAGGNLDTVDGAFFDADHDGDLDLFLVNSNGANELLNNNLDGTFRPLAADRGLTGADDSRMVLPADVDGDRDTDIIVLNAAPPHEVYINDRLWAYRPADGFETFRNSSALAVLAADVDADGAVELYTVHPDGRLLRWQPGPAGEFEADTLGALDSLRDDALAHLASYDVDGDGVLELIASSANGWTAYRISADTAEPGYSVTAAPNIRHVASAPIVEASGSGLSMLGLTDADTRLSIWRPGPGRHPFITLKLSGRQDDAQSMRSNASGIGARVAVRTGSRWSVLHTFRNETGPGQSLQPLAVGLAGADKADFVAIDWSDGVFQSEINVATAEMRRITETQRQLSSCPVLFAWNGEKYAFVSDFLGVGGIGYSIGPGEYTTPRPRESFLFPDGLLQARDGRYVVKIGEPMEENAYIDAVRLAVYDLPADWRMVLDERMGIAGPEPTGEARFYREEILPQRAVNDRGDDLLDVISKDDGVAAPVGDLDVRFIGRLSGEHVLTLDFPQLADRDLDNAMLIVDGWVEYPYSQTNFAAWQAGAAYEAPTLEAFANGRWHTVMEQFGYPAGMPRRMSYPLSDLPTGTSRLRLRTNMQIYWDRVAVAFAENPEKYSKQLLPLVAASLRKTGFAKRITYEQHRPDYDYDDLSPFWDTRYMAGFYTRLGPVEELVGDIDDAVAIIGPGEELHIEFQAADAAPEGWRRFFVLESNGWAKDMDLFTRDGETVGPLPDTGKPSSHRDRLHARYNTRYQAGR